MLALSGPVFCSYAVKFASLRFLLQRKYTAVNFPFSIFLQRRYYQSKGQFGKYHNTLCLSPIFCISIFSSFSWDLQWSQEKTKTMLMQNLGGRQTKSIMVFSELAYLKRASPTMYRTRRRSDNCIIDTIVQIFSRFRCFSRRECLNFQ